MQQQALDQIFEYEDYHWWFTARRAIVRKLLGVSLPGNNNRILEVGCGSGGNFELLSSYGSIWAVEQDDEARERAAARDLASVLHGSLPDDLPVAVDGEFDLICLLDVLEHVDQDERALLELNARLADDGLLLITVPAYAFLWSRHDDLNQHKRRYTRSKLQTLVRRCGFEPVYATYFNTVLFPIVAGIRMVRNRLHGAVKPDFQKHSTAVNRLLHGVMSAERLIMPRLSLPYGVSILLLAGKTTRLKAE